MLETEESEVDSVLNGRFSIMGRHVFLAAVFHAPTAMVNDFNGAGSSNRVFTFAGAVSFGTTTVGVHGVEVICYIK